MGGAFLSHPGCPSPGRGHCLLMRVGGSLPAPYLHQHFPHGHLPSLQSHLNVLSWEKPCPASLSEMDTPISNHYDLPLLQIPKMILSDAFTCFLSCFQNTLSYTRAQPSLPHSALNPSMVLGAQQELSQHQRYLLEALLNQALCTQHLTEFS